MGSGAGVQTLAAGPSWGAYWNYLRRQLYVMDTWAGTHNRRLNHGMLALHCWLSWALVGPALAGVSPPCVSALTPQPHLRRASFAPLLVYAYCLM